MSAKLLSIKHIFELACGNNQLYDANIFDYHIVPFLDPKNQLNAFLGWNNFKDFANTIVEKKLENNRRGNLLTTLKLYDELQSIENYSSKRIYNNRGELIQECWHQCGKLNSTDDQPAVINYVDNKIYEKIWYLNDMVHRDNDLPAIIQYFKNKIYEKHWYLNGDRRRENNKPSSIVMFNGKEMAMIL